MIAILFADLRAFTRFAERRLPYDVVFVLNRYFSAMGSAIEGAGGRVDKFIGDGVMALFGIEEGPERGCRAALAAARAIVEEMGELNRSLAPELREPLRIGIGIHVGSAIVGEMGHARSTSLTAIGDAVNTASRLEAMTKEYQAQLVISEDVARYAGLEQAALPRHEIMIRGREEPLAILVVADALGLPASLRTAPRSSSARSAGVRSGAVPATIPTCSSPGSAPSTRTPGSDRRTASSSPMRRRGSPSRTTASSATPSVGPSD